MLKPGSFLGQFEILSPLGAGGMGEVWRAHDAKLHRDVAIKVLTEALASNPERLLRFRREAQTLASLNHPNIAMIYDLQQDGNARYIVLELVEGQTLAERIRLSPLLLDEALPIAKQIADALEAAHEKGIVHRDLKPANIKITPEGKVKVLDFGLAKIAEPAATTDLPHSLTVVSQTAGLILGTPGYLSPEQARGKAVDKRTDIWTFGCVLFEMLTGTRAFTGETVSDIVAAILTRDVDWRALPANLPEKIRELVQRCLHKDPARRLRDIGDARISLEEIMSSQVETPALGLSAKRRHPILTWAAIALSFVVGLGVMWLRQPGSQPPPVFSGAMIGGPDIAMAPRISPDSRLVAFQAMIDGDTQVAVMQPDSGDWSVLTHDRTRGFIGALSWSFDGTKIYYGRTHGVPRGVFSVPAVGGEERLVLENASCPEALPDGSLLVIRLNESRQPQIYRFWPDSGRLVAYPGTIFPSDMFNVMRAFRDGKEAVFWGRSTDQPETDPNVYLYRLDLTSASLSRISTTIAPTLSTLGSPHLLTVSADDRSIVTTDDSGDLVTIVQIPRAGGPAQRLISLTHQIYGLDSALNGDIYVDQGTRGMQVILAESDGSRPQTILSSNNELGPPSIVMPDGRLLFTARSVGRSSLVVSKRDENPTPFIQTTEETTGPVAMIGRSQVAFLIGSDKRRQVAIASAADGRILRRLEKVDGPSIYALAGSPDGKTLYYAASGKIWAMPSDDGPSQKIAEGDSVAVDPQGRYLIVQLNEKENVKLVRLPLAGGPAQPLSFPDLPLAQPRMAPNAVRGDGRIVKTASYSDSWSYSLAVLDPNFGSVQRVVLPFFLDVMYAGWTPSGQIVAFGAKMNVSIWRMRPVPAGS